MSSIRAREMRLPKDAVFTMKLEAALRDEFVAEARPLTDQHRRWCAS